MTHFIDVLLVGCSMAALVPALTLAAQVVAAMLARNAYKNRATSQRGRVAIIVPAHNETRMLPGTLAALFRQIGGGDRIVVVADNCSDDTAQVAETLGAEVVIRNNDVHRGKGYAMARGVEYLARHCPPDVVVFVDADCLVAQGAIQKLTSAALSTGRPVQARYLLQAPPRAGLGVRVSEFAVRLKNHIRPSGGDLLAMPCGLTGSGMAFPWSTVRSVELATSNIVEDLALGINLTLMGHSPIYCADALVTSPLPLAESSHTNQRKRWEQGHLATIVRKVPTLLISAVRQQSWKCFAAALDLLVLPLTLLLLVQSALLVVDLLWTGQGGSGWPLSLQIVSLLLISGSISIAWHMHGRDLLTVRDFFYVPLYVMKKIPMYWRIGMGDRVGWTRTERD
ncbi:glycosyltransferase family 2 protein [Paraburkholderia sp. C35]|uniref:glycosyltransferase family 2 protein n=1 Tax=Paraburkholderia sp. C35 TaxID=2126993 RepID=UPI000D69E683|nr:glycosyltransferase family 2 protein [Paraburkholderia sp. C35]